MKQFLELLASVAIAGLLQGCLNISTQLNVVKDGLVLVNDQGKVAIPVGVQKALLTVSTRSTSPSELAFSDLNQKFRLNLPDSDVLANIIDPLSLDAKSLGQNISMIIQRKVDVDKDHYIMTIKTADGTQVLASGEFLYKSSQAAYDERSQSFLLSFQEVMRSQRSAVVSIDGGLPNESLNDIVNHGAQILLAPWLYARYSTVNWLISSSSMERSEKVAQWKAATDASPVVDYFAFNHSSSDEYAMEGASFKKHQLRFVYTEGCSSSYYIGDFLKAGAAVAIGHHDTSASPFFAFPLIHAWTYGFSAGQSMVNGWKFGKVFATAGNLATAGLLGRSEWQGNKDMLASSEPVITWTQEMRPEKLDISTSAVLERKQPEQQIKYFSLASEFFQNIVRVGSVENSPLVLDLN